MSKPRIAIVALTSLVLTTCGQHSVSTWEIEAPEEYRAIRERINIMVEKGEIPSLAVAVARGGEIIWMVGIGWADKAARITAGPDTVYAIGSTSKSLTATLAMALAEKGLFDIDKEIDEYLEGATLPFLAIDGFFPSTRQLLQMTGGVPHGGGIVGQPEYTRSRDAMNRSIAVTAYPPGTVYEYSNYSIGLAMHAMERATGRSMADLMQDYVFGPLEMSSSSVSYSEGQIDLALLHGPDAEVIDYYRFFPEGAGGFYSSVNDLMRFALFHAGHWQPEETVISVANLAHMHAARPADIPGAFTAIGFGNAGKQESGITQLVSNGSVRGGNSHISIFEPAGDVVITALNMTSNSSAADVLALDISEVLLPGIKSEFLDRLTSYLDAKKKPFTGDSALTGRWKGTLESVGYSSPVELSISETGGIDITLGSAAPVALQNLRNPFGSVTGKVDGLPIDDSGRGELIGSQQLRLSLQGDILYGHITIRASDGETRGSYPYRMRLSRAL